jgi:uncharacterized membrane protein
VEEEHMTSIKNKDDEHEIVLSWIRRVPLIILIILAIVLIPYYWRFPGCFDDNRNTWGTFGDYVGGLLNPIFALIGLIAILYTVYLQSKELHESRKQQAEAAFENMFFQLLRRFSDVVSEIQYLSPYDNNTFTGREGLRLLWDNAFVGPDGMFQRVDSKLSLDERIITAYKNFYNIHRSILGHYFRSLYHVISFIDRSQISNYNKTIYANIVRAQLSSPELSLLFYNGLIGEGKKGFKPLIEKYGLLKHVAAQDLLNPKHKENPEYYSPSAFQGREERGILPD